MHRSLVDLLRHRADETPSQVFLRFLKPDGSADCALTFGELDLRARRLAAYLQSVGASGERALLLHPQGLDYVVGLFGALYAGAVPVPAYPPSSKKATTRLRGLAQDAGARFALATALDAKRLGEGVGRDIGLAALEWVTPSAADDADDAEWHPPPLTPETLAYLQYTSGSTSAPKGVMISHGNVLHNAGALAKATGSSPEDRAVFWLPLYHDMGLIGGIMTPLVVGTECVLMSPLAFLRDPARWLKAIDQFGATVSGAPNFALELCVRRTKPEQRAALNLRRWRVAFCGAERVRAGTLERFAAAFAPAGFRPRAFCPCYGLAEATLGVTLAPPGGTGATVQSIEKDALAAGRVVAARSEARGAVLVGSGKPLSDVQVAIVDPETLRDVDDGRVGEICVQSPGVALGYWHRPELTSAAFPSTGAARRLRTGDLGFILDGELYVTGRIKDLIIRNGANYYPEDLEDTAAASHRAVRKDSCAAFSVDTGEQERLVIVQEVDSPRSTDLSDVVSTIRGAVAEHHEIEVQDVVLVAGGVIPKTSSGKVRRGECKTLYERGGLPSLVAPFVAADSAPPDLIESVRRVMTQVLGVDDVGPDEDFFTLGGHSLLATQLASRLTDRLGVDVGIRAVFDTPTARQLAGRVAQLPKVRPLAIRRIDRHQPLPLSFSQLRMWFLHQLDPQGAAYNVAGSVTLKGPLDVPLLERALNAVIDRHEILRTNYVARDGEPQVRIGSGCSALVLECVDVSGLADPTAAAVELISKLAHRPFDLASDRLLRAELYRLGPDHHAVGVCMHHIVTDAWSMGLLLDEVLQFYSLYRGETSSPPEPLPYQYVDYAHFQRELLSEERLADDLAYWQKHLEGARVLELPATRPGRTRKSSAGDLEPLEIPSDLLLALQEIGRLHGATPFMVHLAAFAALLYRYTGQSDIIVGIPIANRNRLSSERFIGTLVNTLPLRVQFDPDGTFADLLRNARNSALEAYAHQELPLERLVAELGIERRGGRSPLFDVMFDFQNAPLSARRSQELEVKPLFISRGASQFDLSLLVLDADVGQAAAVEYSTERFDVETMRGLLRHYLVLLTAFANDPSASFARVALLTEGEVAQATARGPTFSEPAMAMHRRFETVAASMPDALAVSDGRLELSYAELDARANQFAARLAGLAVQRGVRVAVFLDRSCDLIVALLAIMKAGGAYVPLDPGYPPARIRAVLEDSKPSLIVTQNALRGQVEDISDVPHVEVDAGISAPGLSSSVDPRPDWLAYILYTSGSTGRPKGVQISVGALANFLASMSSILEVTPEDKLLAVTTVAFDIAGLELLLPLTIGAAVTVAPSAVAVDAKRLAQFLTASDTTVMQATPATWRMLMEGGWIGATGLKVLCGGEPLTAVLAHELLQRSSSLWNLYGPTETTIWSTCERVAHDDTVTIGRPIHETTVYVLDRHGLPVPRGVYGELYIGGAGVAKGYWGSPELTHERFAPDPFQATAGAWMYRTGDRGRLRHDGRLECLGRVDLQLKVRGYRIEPGDVEAAILKHAGVRAAVVIAREDRPGDVRLAGYYESEPGIVIDASVLRAHLKASLPDYMVPQYLISLPALPLTPNGKIARGLLPAPRGSDIVTGVECVAPRDSLELAVAQVWSDVLGVAMPSVRDNFFDKGGHSLLAVRLLALIETKLGIGLPLASLLEAGTIERITEAIRELQQQPEAIEPLAPRRPSRPPGASVSANGHAFAHTVFVRRSGNRAPLFCVHGAGGNVLNLEPMSRYLARPLIGFQARGVNGIEQPFARIEDMAATYLDELRTARAQGPYYLSGYCGGGIVAFEIAQRLVAQGEEVAFLGLIDTYHPGVAVPGTDLSERLVAVRRAGPRYLAERALARLQRDARRVSSDLRIWISQARSQPVPVQLRDYWLTVSFLAAAGRYCPEKYPGVITAFRAVEHHPELNPYQSDLGWGSSARLVRVYDVPGDHESIAHEPNAAVLGAKLEECMLAAETGILGYPV